MKRLPAVLALLCSIAATARTQAFDWSEVEGIFGRKGSVIGDVFKITFPRTDLKVTIGDVPIEAGLALTSWIAFKAMSHRAMIMGDLVLTEKEVDPVMKRLVANGVEVTALHNHLINERPVVMYMHFSGQGDPAQLAEAMKDALSGTDTPMGPPPLNPEPAAASDWSKVESILGVSGQRKGNIIQFGIARSDSIMEYGMLIPASMGMAISINMQKLGTKAATTGDFVLTASEVNPVVKDLTGQGIVVTALHSHMLNESPRLFFMHFWAVDDPEKLAQGLRAALNETNFARKK